MADLTGAHAVMALAHLAAAVLVGLWLAVGERALWHLVVLAADRVRSVVAAACSSYARVRWGARALLAPLPLRDDGPPRGSVRCSTASWSERGPPLLPVA
jgi:hypothetical protein